MFEFEHFKCKVLLTSVDFSIDIQCKLIPVLIFQINRSYTKANVPMVALKHFQSRGLLKQSPLFGIIGLKPLSLSDK